MILPRSSSVEAKSLEPKNNNFICWKGAIIVGRGKKYQKSPTKKKK